MSDLVSRTYLLEAVFEGWIRFDTEADENRYIHLIRDMTPDAEPKWIPCSERLPEPNVYVLMTTAWGSVTIGERIYPTINNTVYFIHDGTTNAELDDVVAWCKLPEPYRGENE